MQLIMGCLLVLVGVVLVILAILAWLGILSPKEKMKVAEASWPDVFIAIIKTVPWVALVGLSLIYAGLRTFGVVLSPG